jgi:hypothetical protein
MADEKENTEVEKAKGGMKKTIGLVVIGLGVGLLVGKMFLFKSEPASTNVVVEAPTTTELNRLAATSVTLDSKSVNLADGHYAKIQVTVYLQEAGAGHGTAATGDALKPSLAKINADLIAFVSGKPIEEVASAAFQQELRTFLLEEAHVDYHGAVADIQISDFVTQ